MLNIYRLVVLILAVLAFSGSSLAQEASVQPVGVGKVGPTPSTLNVLYAGKPDSQRMKDFVAFLQKHFATVGTHDLQTDFADAAAAYDVVILDWTPIYPRNKAGLLDSTNPNAEPDNPKIAITAQFSKPVVMIGATGGQLIHQLGGQLKLAIDYRCLCLENYAHSTNLKHPIFQGPLPVEVKQETVEKPFGYFSYPGMKKIGETIQAWKVQDHTVPYCDPGLVASASVVSQAKDGEAISGGFNDKGPTSVAIARHGNYLLWGFSAPPAEMTDAGRAAFVNSVCYMDAFDGQLPKGVRGAYIDRDYGLYMVYHLRLTSPENLAAVVQYHQKRAAISPLPPQALAQIGDDIPAYYKKLFQPAVTRTLDNIPTEIRRRCEDDSEKIIAYYTENYDYLYCVPDGQQRWLVDEDAKSLGIANYKSEMLQRCIALLESDQQTEMATRILERYTGQHFENAKQWRLWYDQSGKNWNFDEQQFKFVDLPFDKMQGYFD